MYVSTEKQISVYMKLDKMSELNFTSVIRTGVRLLSAVNNVTSGVHFTFHVNAA